MVDVVRCIRRFWRGLMIIFVSVLALVAFLEIDPWFVIRSCFQFLALLVFACRLFLLCFVFHNWKIYLVVSCFAECVSQVLILLCICARLLISWPCSCFASVVVDVFCMLFCMVLSL